MMQLKLRVPLPDIIDEGVHNLMQKMRLKAVSYQLVDGEGMPILAALPITIEIEPEVPEEPSQ